MQGWRSASERVPCRSKEVFSRATIQSLYVFKIHLVNIVNTERKVLFMQGGMDNHRNLLGSF